MTHDPKNTAEHSETVDLPSDDALGAAMEAAQRAARAVLMMAVPGIDLHGVSLFAQVFPRLQEGQTGEPERMMVLAMDDQWCCLHCRASAMSIHAKRAIEAYESGDTRGIGGNGEPPVRH